MTSGLTLSTHLDLVLTPNPFLDLTEVPSLLQNPHSAIFAWEQDGTKGGGQKAGAQDIQGGEQLRCRAVESHHLEAVSWLDNSSISVPGSLYMPAAFTDPWPAEFLLVGS